MSSRGKGNPFAQVPQYWKVTFALPQMAVATAENAFTGIAIAVSAFETDEKNHLWAFELLCEVIPDMTEIRRRLLVLSSLFDAPTPEPQIQQIQHQDWLAAVSRSFPPMVIGRFYVHGAHVKSVPPGAVSIQVDAGAAFGSGEHGTTRCCLEALDWLAKKRGFRNILDMGCGSGILGIAAAKLWKTRVLAADIDAMAVRVTEENSRLNRTVAWVDAVQSDGYASERIRRAAPFDLIISNILARPLIAFAPDLKAHLAEGGVAVLSGLLASQENDVRSAHAAQGLKLVKRFVSDQWCTLVLE